MRATYRLSSPKGTVGSHYDVVVIGSGYGGSVAASRFARSGLRVCVLEKGREYAPGEFPDTPLAPFTDGTVRVHPEAVPGRPSSRSTDTSGVIDLGPDNALYQLNVFGAVVVAHGCGLGGTSLVNAGVTVRPDSRVLTDAKSWPQGFLSRSQELEESYKKAEQMLGAKAYPSGKNGVRESPKEKKRRRRRRKKKKKIKKRNETKRNETNHSQSNPSPHDSTLCCPSRKPSESLRTRSVANFGNHRFL